MVSRDHDLSVRRQCRLLLLARSNLYYRPRGESAENLKFMKIIRCLTGHYMPEKGQAVSEHAVVRGAPPSRAYFVYPAGQWMARYMQRLGHKCGRHHAGSVSPTRRVRRLMRLMRLVPIYQAPNTRCPATHAQHV